MTHRSGFSLLEVVILTLVLSIIAVVSMVFFPSTSLFQSHGFRAQLFEDLQLTQVLAMSQNQRYQMVIGANSYQIQDQNNSPVVHPALNTTTITYPSGLTVTPTTTIMFDGLGAPYATGGAPLSATLTLSVSSGGDVNTLTISPQTGLIQ